jgi:hypothetical protein
MVGGKAARNVWHGCHGRYFEGRHLGSNFGNLNGNNFSTRQCRWEWTSPFFFWDQARVKWHITCPPFPFKIPKLNPRWRSSKWWPWHPCHTFRAALPPTTIYCEPGAYDKPFWDKGVLTDLCLTLYITFVVLVLQVFLAFICTPIRPNPILYKEITSKKIGISRRWFPDNTQFTIILPSKHRSSNWSLSFRVPDKKSVHTSLLPHKFSVSRFDHIDTAWWATKIKNSSLWNFLQRPSTSSPQCQNIFLKTLFSNVLFRSVNIYTKT